MYLIPTGIPKHLLVEICKRLNPFDLESLETAQVFDITGTTFYMPHEIVRVVFYEGSRHQLNGLDSQELANETKQDSMMCLSSSMVTQTIKYYDVGCQHVQ